MVNVIRQADLTNPTHFITVSGLIAAWITLISYALGV